jgi:hypothetical protein
MPKVLLVGGPKHGTWHDIDTNLHDAITFPRIIIKLSTKQADIPNSAYVNDVYIQKQLKLSNHKQMTVYVHIDTTENDAMELMKRDYPHLFV